MNIQHLINRDMSLTDALEYVKERRSIARPNEGFLKQLAEWQVEKLERLGKFLCCEKRNLKRNSSPNMSKPA